MTGIIIGLAAFIIGAGTGVFMHAMVLNSKDADNRMHEFFKNKDAGARDESNDQSPTK